MGLLSESSADGSAKGRVEVIRQAMLTHLADLDANQRLVKVRIRIQYAPDIQALWYLRGDVMTLLAEALGEAVATQRLSEMTDQFRGLLPAAQQSRPNRLHK